MTETIAPYMAPLSSSMVEKTLKTLSIDVNDAFLSDFLPIVNDARAEAYRRVQQVLDQEVLFNREGLTTQWLIEQISSLTERKTKPISPESLSRWRENALLLYDRENRPNADRVVSLLMLRILTAPKLVSAWLPTRLPDDPDFFKNEARWWCWRQDSPTEPIRSCPFPFPPGIPDHALLWTGYVGAHLADPLWMRVSDLGCCRWQGTVHYRSQWLWSLTEKDLEQWGTHIGDEYRDILDQDAPLIRHALSTATLLKLATSRLKELQRPIPDSHPPVR